jgi:HSP20 family molecular chaperone IbpA
MCLCTNSHHNSSDNINIPTTMSMSMSMSMSPPTSTSSSPVIKNIGFDDGISWDDITIQEDETCYLLSIDMPNVNGKDVNITLQKNIITISGYRRCCARSSRSLSFSSTSTNSSTSSEEEEDEQQQQQQQRSHHKRQRLVNRRLEIDSNIIDIDRAIANTWNGSLTLYAPKRRTSSY